MSTYLTELVSRARGPASDLRPRRETRFEPWAPAETAGASAVEGDRDTATAPEANLQPTESVSTVRIPDREPAAPVGTPSVAAFPPETDASPAVSTAGEAGLNLPPPIPSRPPAGTEREPTKGAAARARARRPAAAKGAQPPAAAPAGDEPRAARGDAPPAPTDRPVPATPPVHPPVREPAAPALIAGTPDASPPADGAASARVAPRASSPTEPAPPARRDDRRRPARVEPATVETVLRSPADDLEPVILAAPPSLAEDRPAAASTQLRGPTDRAAPVSPRVTQAPAPVLTPRSREARRAPRPPADVQAPPAIQVSIGRVEVRAVTPPPARPQPRRRPPRLSLEEYLRDRAGGGR